MHDMHNVNYNRKHNNRHAEHAIALLCVLSIQGLLFKDAYGYAYYRISIIMLIVMSIISLQKSNRNPTTHATQTLQKSCRNPTINAYCYAYHRISIIMPISMSIIILQKSNINPTTNAIPILQKSCRIPTRNSYGYAYCRLPMIMPIIGVLLFLL